ncbi:PspC domain-containing protein [Leucobacter ruminantium]|uniref:PspC domain-containing protein n=1 Tax=Leucobacter ruminantium TaxID=1289170 RepID=A0A939LW40_9MICO|nr:PspC domain-containing protein [Leucobacter ruminantium]MBO1805512.1 PspC domain-containing protein [Leucobacter ruminantium]
MNTTPESERQGVPSSGGSFFTWLRGLGIVRGSDRWFAGVAGGIAAKAGIDPLIVRGVFVVLTLLGGPGLLLYLVGWLLLPDETGRIHTEEIIRGRASSGMIITAAVVAGVIIIPLFVGLVFGGAPFAGTPGFWGWDLWSAMGVPLWLMRTVGWLFWIAVLVAAFFLVRHLVLQHGRERRENSAGDACAPGGQGAQSATARDPSRMDSSPSDSAAPAGERPATAAFSAQRTASGRSSTERPFEERAGEWAARTSERAEEWGRSFGERASRWGEEVGQQADEWSARYAEHHDAHRMGTAQTVLSLAFALLAGGAAAIWVGFEAASAGGRIDSGAAPALVAGLTASVAVLALSLIIVGIRGRHTGWVGFLAACGVFALLATVVLPGGTRFQPFGTMQVDGRTATGAVLIAGSADIDLRDLDERGPDSDIVIWQLAGDTSVRLPDDTPVDLDVRVLAGRIDDHGARPADAAAGAFLGRTVSVGAPGKRESAIADDGIGTVTVYLLAGGVDVTGGQRAGDEPADQNTRTRERETQR